MDVLILTAFISLVLVTAGIVFLAWSIRQGSHEHVDRMVLLPLHDEPADKTTVTTREDP